MEKERIKYYRDIMADMHLASAHSHIPAERVFHDEPFSFINIIGYCIPDLVSVGMPKKGVRNLSVGVDELHVSYGYDLEPDNLSINEKWEIVKKYWPYVRNIGSGLHARKTLQMFFGVDDLTDETIPIIEKKIPEIQKKTYKELYESVKIDKVMGVSLGGSRKNPSTDLVPQQLYSDTYTQPCDRASVHLLEDLSGISIYSLNTYVQALDKYIDDEIKAGMVGFKWHITPFMREHSYDLPNQQEASAALDKILTGPTRGSLFSALGYSYQEMKPLHDYLQNHLIHKAIEYDVPLQIHTGTFGVTSGNKLENSRPSLLSTMFMRYPQAKFNLLHSSWPYCREVAEIARQFPNVYLNTTWMQIISPIAFKDYMKEWALWVPTKKILGYGCDEFNVLNSCACAEIYRDLMSEVLAELTEEGRMTEKDAIFYANRVSRENVYDHWKLKK